MSTDDFFTFPDQPEPDWRGMVKRLPEFEKQDLKHYFWCDRPTFIKLVLVRTKIMSLIPPARLKQLAHIRDLHRRRDLGQAGIFNANKKFGPLRKLEMKLVGRLRTEQFSGGVP